MIAQIKNPDKHVMQLRQLQQSMWEANKLAERSNYVKYLSHAIGATKKYLEALQDLDIQLHREEVRLPTPRPRQNGSSIFEPYVPMNGQGQTRTSGSHGSRS
jgi:hypothetical protein